MEQYPYLADIEVSRLRLDLRNPRLAELPDSQREAFGRMAQAPGSKLLGLCRHIARHGLSPAHRFLVIPDDDNQFIVMDANRRLTALRALEQPDLVEGHLSESEMKQLRLLSDSFSPPEEVPCVVFARREDVDVWVEILHEGESEGAGLVPWTSQQKSRHRARRGAKPAHLQVLDFVAEAGALSPDSMRRYDRGTYPVSTLERALTTPHVRQRLGIDVVEGQVQTAFPKPEVLKGLTKLVDEIGTGTVKVADFMTLSDRVRYIDGFKDRELPDPGSTMEALTPLDQAPEKSKGTNSKQKDRRGTATRSKLIPSEFSIRIDTPRINDIYLELKRKLRVDEVPNAAGVLLRVFLELSVDDYIERNQIRVKFKDKNLANKVSAVVDSMQAGGFLVPKDAVPVREAVKSPDNVTLATNLNALVHNRLMTVSGNDLKAIWGRLALFFEKLWA